MKVATVEGRQRLVDPDTEARMQARLWEYMQAYLKKGAVAFAVPNGGKRLAREAVSFKRQGVVAGIPDMQIVFGGMVYFLELKIPGGRVSEDQAMQLSRLQMAGARVAVVHGFDQAVAQLRQWALLRPGVYS